MPAKVGTNSQTASTPCGTTKQFFKITASNYQDIVKSDCENGVVVSPFCPKEAQILTIFMKVGGADTQCGLVLF
jgi:hypothetical protein